MSVNVTHAFHTFFSPSTARQRERIHGQRAHAVGRSRIGSLGPGTDVLLFKRPPIETPGIVTSFYNGKQTTATDVSLSLAHRYKASLF